MVILTDDEDRENEGDLVMAAEKVTPEAINFMATHGRGLICLSLTEERIRQLDLPLMVPGQHLAVRHRLHRLHRGARAASPPASPPPTARAPSWPRWPRGEARRPGHAPATSSRSAPASGGVLVRTGQTEGSVDLARLAGLFPAGVICEVMNADGTMARRPELERFARKHGLTLLSRRRPHPLPAAAASGW